MKRMIVALGLMLAGNLQANSPVYKDLRSFNCSVQGQGLSSISSIHLKDLKDIDTRKFKAVLTLNYTDGTTAEYATPETDEDPQLSRDNNPNGGFGLGGLEVYPSTQKDSKEILVTNTNDEQIDEDERFYDFAIGYPDSETAKMMGQLICTLNQK
jgi:hypothetical protein